MLWETLKAARDIGRLHEIASVMIRYGFGDAVKRLGMSRILEQAGKVLRWKDAEKMARMESPERVRRAFEELGPTFIKLGQILASRVDLFSQEWIEEFEKLQDQVPPRPFDELRMQIQEDLGDAPENIFLDLDTTALAAGSIAQVHRARLETGEDIILKIRYPGIRPIIEADLRLLSRLAEITEKEVPEWRRFHPKDVLQQVTMSLRRELDLASECRYAERIAESFKDDPTISLPRVFWEWTSERLNVQEYIDGIPGKDIEAIDAAGLDRKLLAVRGANAVLKMVLEDGFYHADPHPGNLFFLSGNRIVIIDTGMVGRLSSARQTQVIDLIRGLVARDTAQVIDVLIGWTGDEALDTTDKLAIEIDSFLDSYHGLALKDLNIAAMLTDITVIMRDNELVMPPDLALLFKVFITLEGLGRLLDPEFDMVSEAEPFLKRAMLARYHPDVLARKGWKNFTEFVELLSSLPRDLRRLLQSARRGALEMNVDITRLDQFGHELDRAASRLTVGLVTAAMIIGTSIVMTVEGGPTMFGLPVLGLLGFLGAGIGGVWLLISIWRSGRHK